MKRATKKNFHLPMNEGLYERLQAEAERSGLPATAIAREAIAEYLSHKQRETIDQAIHTYAQRGCDLQVDLDPALEEAGVDLLRAEYEGAPDIDEGLLVALLRVTREVLARVVALAPPVP